MNDDRSVMGTYDEAFAGLVDSARKAKSLKGPRMDTAAGHKKHEAMSREADSRLVQSALLWLWHIENPDPTP